MLTPAQKTSIETVRDWSIRIIGWAAILYPPMKPFVWIIDAFIRVQAAQLMIGIATGAIVPDGQGGFVPVSNSHYNPQTGLFETGPFSTGWFHGWFHGIS